MQTLLQFSDNVLEELNALVKSAHPDFQGVRGSLFISKTAPVSAICLTAPKDEFLQSVLDLPELSTLNIVPVEGYSFDIVITGNVAVCDGALTINGKQATIV